MSNSIPFEPPPTSWSFPPAEIADKTGMVSLGADVKPGTLLAAYRMGLFPMPIGNSDVMGWWSPDPRGVIWPKNITISRSLRRAKRRYEIRINSDFEGVIIGCASQKRPNSWINNKIITAYKELHNLGWAHSIEAWDEEGLAGGLYGISIGGLFAGESMFHKRTDASKVALVALAELLGEEETRLIDIQWHTAHLASLGASEISRLQYLQLLPNLLTGEIPNWVQVKQLNTQ